MKVAVNIPPFLALHESHEVRSGRAEEPQGQHWTSVFATIYRIVFEDRWTKASANITWSNVLFRHTVLVAFVPCWGD